MTLEQELTTLTHLIEKILTKTALLEQNNDHLYNFLENYKSIETEGLDETEREEQDQDIEETDESLQSSQNQNLFKKSPRSGRGILNRDKIILEKENVLDEDFIKVTGDSEENMDSQEVEESISGVENKEKMLSPKSNSGLLSFREPKVKIQIVPSSKGKAQTDEDSEKE